MYIVIIIKSSKPMVAMVMVYVLYKMYRLYTRGGALYH